MSTRGSDTGHVDSLTERIEESPIAPGVLGGVGAFVAGFAATVVIVTLSGSVSFENPGRKLRELGNIFYSAQNVPLLRHREIAIGDQTVVQEASINLLQQASPSLPRLVYYLVPVLAIAAVAAWLVAHHVDLDDPVEDAGGLAGGMALGYVLAMLVGTFLVSLRTAGQGAAFETLGPVQLWALVYGIAYPLVVTAVVLAVFLSWHSLAETSSVQGEAS